MTCAGLYRPLRKPRGLVTDAPCRTAYPNRLTPLRVGSTKDPFHKRRTTAAAFQARSAFRRRIPSARGPCWRLDRGRLGRHWCLGFAASAQLPARVHAQALRARPNHLAGCSPELRGHVPFVNFCNVRDPRARPPIRQTSPHLGWQATPQQAAPPLRAVPAGLLQLRGLPGSRRTLAPASTSARRSGFSPTCFVRTPLVAD
jgi:hypothetical protein